MTTVMHRCDCGRVKQVCDTGNAEITSYYTEHRDAYGDVQLTYGNREVVKIK